MTINIDSLVLTHKPNSHDVFDTEYSEGKDHPNLEKGDLLLIDDGKYGVTVDQFINNTDSKHKFSHNRDKRIAKLKALTGKKLSECSPGMSYIPPGSFKMGSEEGDSDEKPEHEVVFSSGFCMDQKEFTQGYFDKVRSKSKKIANFSANIKSPDGFDDPKQPLARVAWGQAQSLCEFLGKRLPTEAEWEYAAKGERDLKFATPDGQPDKDGQKQINYNSAGTVKVGSYAANPFDLSDMSGNVAEWVADWYGPYGSKSQENPTGPKRGTYRVTRGGSWSGGQSEARSANRSAYPPQFGLGVVGFRCAAPQDSIATAKQNVRF